MGILWAHVGAIGCIVLRCRVWTGSYSGSESYRRHLIIGTHTKLAPHEYKHPLHLRTKASRANRHPLCLEQRKTSMLIIAAYTCMYWGARHMKLRHVAKLTCTCRFHRYKYKK